MCGRRESGAVEVYLNGTWELKVDGMDQPADVRVPDSYAGQDQLWSRDHWNVWDYPKAWKNQAAVYSKTFQMKDLTASPSL